MMSGGLLGDEAVIDPVEFVLQSKRLAIGFLAKRLADH